MRVSAIHSTFNFKRVRIDARIDVDTDQRRYHVFLDYPRRNWLDLDTRVGDPFLAIALLPAMSLDEPLYIEAPVSARLQESLPHLQSVFSHMYNLNVVEVIAPVHRRAHGLLPPRLKRGLFFSLGVDSFYSLKRHMEGGSGLPLTHLLTIHGLDIYYQQRNHDLFSEVRERSREVAGFYNLAFVDIVTNQRDFSEKYVNWQAQYGNSTNSLGLALQRGFESFFFSAGLWMFHDGFVPYGSGPLLTPYWGTERVFFHHYGGEMNRREKLQAVSDMPLAMEHLRVCWENRDGAYNCGRCEKCLRTMIGLYILGKLEDCRTFPDKINLDHVRKLRINNPTVLPDYRTLVDDLSAMENRSGFASELKTILSERVAHFQESRA